MKLTTAAIAAGLGALTGLALGRPRPPFDFANRVVLVTGGSRGLGLVLARQLVDRGARVAILARDPGELYLAQTQLVERGGEVLALTCDVSRREDVEASVQAAVDHFGRLDVVINNAGIIQVAPLEHLDVDDFEASMRVHLFGPLYTTLAALPHLERVDGGRIVNISSIGGLVAIPHMLPYSASKHALVGLSDGLRYELARRGVRVTTVCPGLMRTGSPPNALFGGQHRKEHAWFAIGDSLPLVSKDAEDSAYEVLEACRKGTSRLTITVQARLFAIIDEVFPGVSSAIMETMGRLLPEPSPEGLDEAVPGAASGSFWAPSLLTTLSQEAGVRNNEIDRRS